MMFTNKIRYAGALTILSVMGIATQLSARENIVTSRRTSELKATATGCLPAKAELDMDINNIRAHYMTGGDMWWNRGIGVAAYEIPINSGKSSQFAASCWIGGYDAQGQLKVAGQTYRQSGNDYWPGALDNDGKITQDNCSGWDKFWKVDKSTINSFIQLFKAGVTPTGAIYQTINEWPAVGNSNVIAANGTSRLSLDGKHTYAPFVDLNGDGLYEPEKGEYPDISGDELMWWVFNDAGNVKQMSITASIGVEIQTSVFAYATQDFLNNSTFCNYRVINRGALTIDSTYIAVWDDADLGYYQDDYIGCDTSRGLGILYNGTNDDGSSAGHPVNSYGLNPPQIALDFFQGPIRPVTRPGKSDTIERLGMTNFTYYNNDFSIIGNPNNGIEMYNYMTGSIRTGQRFAYDFQGGGVPSKGYGSGAVSNFVFWGDPGSNSDWSECTCGNPPGDRRFIFSSGPFKLLPGAINDITFGCVWSPQPAGGCPQTTFKVIKSIDDQAQALFDNHFKTVEGPEAPRLVVRELDRRLIFYMVNDYGSNNYAENFGRSDGTYIDSIQYHQSVVKALGLKKKDSLYKFQGYRVFQLANSQVNSSQIFDQTTGEVDNNVAHEVFQCDVRDSVKMIVNYTKNLAISDSTTVAQIKVVGRDSGIVHSFELTSDAFATGSDKRFVNYHNYYFVAIAYAYNNFASFDPKRPDNTQDAPYIGSAHGAGGIDIRPIAALPNPANLDMGTVLNADYGMGVSITRMEGKGNGGNFVQLDEASETAILENGSIDKAVYKVGQGPIDVKVIDPVKVKAMNWTLQILGNTTNAAAGLSTASTWKLTNSEGDVIYSEKPIGLYPVANEQIIEKYGLSVAINQVQAPGANTTLGNGYISSDITFEDPTKPWLWGVQDLSDSSMGNWLRAGKNTKQYIVPADSVKSPCGYNDNGLDPNNNYENMFANFSPTQSTWGPYVLGAPWYIYTHVGSGTQCGFELAYDSRSQDVAHFANLNDVNLVLTSDRSKWTRCAVVELQESQNLSQGGAYKFFLRKHRGWNLEVGSDGNALYSEVDSDMSMSYFPGYAIDEVSGQRLNIVFGEDSYLASDNGNDMIWNPSANQYNTTDGSVIFGGKHVIYILGTKYDQDKAFVTSIKSSSPASTGGIKAAYANVQWMGVPAANPTVHMLSLKDNLIPTKTTLRFRVTRPYAPYLAADTSTLTNTAAGHATNPYYTFDTKDLAPTPVAQVSDKESVLNRITAVPNPYYGYSGYETNRFSTVVRIINLPPRATVNIYSLDGTLIRSLSKNDPNTSYLDWDIHNSAGLPIASGMYLMDVKADGLGETVIRWFGASRPLDVTTY